MMCSNGIQIRKVIPCPNQPEVCSHRSKESYIEFRTKTIPQKIVRNLSERVHTYKIKRRIFPYNPNLKEKARELRNNSTLSEVTLWGYLKGKQMHGFDFHRQKPVDNYIVDFICCELYMAIELDGYIHLLAQTAERYRKKEECLKQHGIKLIRFWDEEVYHDIDNVLYDIDSIVIEQKKKLGI